VKFTEIEIRNMGIWEMRAQGGPPSGVCNWCRRVDFGSNIMLHIDLWAKISNEHIGGDMCGIASQPS
jgi:hypothetical protein